MNKTNYSFEDMEKMVDNISKIKKKKYLEKIRDIIINNNPNIKITENTNGLFFHFDNLVNKTYHEIEKYIKKISKKKKRVDSNTLSEYIPYSTEEYPFNGDSVCKYTSKEKNLIKRNIYYNEINDDNCVGINDPNIFIKKNSKQ